MSEELNDLLEELASYATAHKDGLALHELEKEYKGMNGRAPQYVQFQCRDMLSLLQTSAAAKHIVLDPNTRRVFANMNEASTAHMTSLVQETVKKNGKNKSNRGGGARGGFRGGYRGGRGGYQPRPTYQPPYQPQQQYRPPTFQQPPPPVRRPDPPPNAWRAPLQMNPPVRHPPPHSTAVPPPSTSVPPPMPRVEPARPVVQRVSPPATTTLPKPTIAQRPNLGSGPLSSGQQRPEQPQQPVQYAQRPVQYTQPPQYNLPPPMAQQPSRSLQQPPSTAAPTQESDIRVTPISGGDVQLYYDDEPTDEEIYAATSTTTSKSATGDDEEDEVERHSLLIVRPQIEVTVPEHIVKNNKLTAEQRERFHQLLDYLARQVFQPRNERGMDLLEIVRMFEPPTVDLDVEVFFTYTAEMILTFPAVFKFNGKTVFAASIAAGYSDDPRLQPYDHLLAIDGLDQECMSVGHLDAGLHTRWSALLDDVLQARLSGERLLCDSYYATTMPQMTPMAMQIPNPLETMVNAFVTMDASDSRRFVKVRLMTCTSMDCLYIIWNDYFEQFTQLENAMKQFYGSRPLESAEYGILLDEDDRLFEMMLVAAPYEDECTDDEEANDRKVEYCRALVVSYEENATECEVMFVDHGGSDTVAVSELRLLPVPFTRLPTQAVKLTLDGVVSPIGDDAMTRATDRILELASQVTDYSGKNGLFAYIHAVQVHDQEDDPLHTTTYTVSLSTTSNGRQSYIHEVLHQEGLVRFDDDDVEGVEPVDESPPPSDPAQHRSPLDHANVSYAHIPSALVEGYTEMITGLMNMGIDGRRTVRQTYDQCKNVLSRNAEGDADVRSINEQIQLIENTIAKCGYRMEEIN